MSTEAPPDERYKFRSALTDIVTITQALAPCCKSIEEMIGVVQLGLSNDAQLRLLMAIVLASKKSEKSGPS